MVKRKIVCQLVQKKDAICQEWDSNPRLHSETRTLDTCHLVKEYHLESGALDRSAILTTYKQLWNGFKFNQRRPFLKIITLQDFFEYSWDIYHQIPKQDWKRCSATTKIDWNNGMFKEKQCDNLFKKKKQFVRSGIRTHASIRRPEHSIPITW